MWVCGCVGVWVRGCVGVWVWMRVCVWMCVCVRECGLRKQLGASKLQTFSARTAHTTPQPSPPPSSPASSLPSQRLPFCEEIITVEASKTCPNHGLPLHGLQRLHWLLDARTPSAPTAHTATTPDRPHRPRRFASATAKKSCNYSKTGPQDPGSVGRRQWRQPLNKFVLF